MRYTRRRDELRQPRRVHDLRAPPRRQARAQRLRAVRTDARRALRPRAGEQARDEGGAARTPAGHVPLPRAHTARRRRDAGDAGRGEYAAAGPAPARRAFRAPPRLGQGRGPEPHRLVQGSRPRHGNYACPSTRRDRLRDPLGGQRRRRRRRVPRALRAAVRGDRATRHAARGARGGRDRGRQGLPQRAPVVKAFHDGADTTAAWENPTTHAAGLRVPSPFAGRQMLKILRDTGGDAVAVSERAIQDAQRLLGRLEGVWTSPEGAALVAALGVLKERRDISADARVVLVLTGAGIKYDPPPLPPAVDLAGSDDDVVAAVRGALGV